jgi:hypothetical protein
LNSNFSSAVGARCGNFQIVVINALPIADIVNFQLMQTNALLTQNIDVFFDVGFNTA